MLNALQMILHICRIVFYVHTIVLAIEHKKVASQDLTNALQLAGIYALALENVIHVGAVAV